MADGTQAKKADPIRLSADAVIELLRQRYDPPAWALFEGVSNGTGRRASRWADALAMSLWPSRGLHVHGFEVKVSRRSRKIYAHTKEAPRQSHTDSMI